MPRVQTLAPGQRLPFSRERLAKPSASTSKLLRFIAKIADRQGKGQNLDNLGLAHADIGETDTAIDFYEQRLAIAQEIGDRRGEGTVLMNTGDAYILLGEFHRAIKYQKRALSTSARSATVAAKATFSATSAVLTTLLAMLVKPLASTSKRW